MRFASTLASTLTIAAAAIFGAPAMAEDATRYAIEQTEDGYVRMDRQTGAMSLCTKAAGELVCRMAVDDRDAYETDIGALEKRLESLEKDVAALRTGPAPSDGVGIGGGSEQEFQTAMDRMESFFRRFMGVVKEFQDDFGAGPTVPAPKSPDQT
jgi:hypothetical protein